MREFKDKVLVVTGGGSGIGAQIAREAALRGMKIVLNDIDAENVEKVAEELRQTGAQVAVQAADISLLENIQALLDLALNTFGSVDVLVNNAGVAVSGPVWEIPLQDIQWITEVNFLSHVYGLRVFLPQMIAQGTECAVVNVASTAGIMVSGTATMYHATKFGDVGLSESTYLGLKGHGLERVQMHCLCPAFVQTTIHKADLHRPERYAINDDPYYQGQEFKAGYIRSERQVLAGMPIDSVGLTVFTAIEENNFYIFTHPDSTLAAAGRLSHMLNGRNPG